VFLFWWPGYQFMLMAGVMAHAVGISAAMIVSRKYGRQRFRFRGSRGQTFEGLAAMAVASFAAIFYTTYSFAKIPGVWFGPWAFFGALMTAAVATVALLYTPRPHEQWSVPILASLTMYYYAKVGFHF
jgi:dolichol kinase